MTLILQTVSSSMQNYYPPLLCGKKTLGIQSWIEEPVKKLSNVTVF